LRGIYEIWSLNQQDFFHSGGIDSSDSLLLL
jgi:hypothetical protein